jgi:transcriptional regulator with XRE-family HTH domain
VANAWTSREAAIHALIGRRIRQAREEAGLAPRALAGRLGIAAARLAGMERGTERLSARQVFEVAGATGKPVSYFFADLDPRGAQQGAQAAAAEAAHRHAIADVSSARLAETRALIAAFYRIADPATRRDVIRLLRGIAEDLR